MKHQEGQIGGMNDKREKKKKRGRMASGRIIKMSSGVWEQRIMFEHERERTGWKSISRTALFKTGRRRTDRVFFYLLKKRNAQPMFCVLKKLKKRATALSSPSFFSVSVISTLEDFVSALLKSCPRSPLCFAPLPSCRSVCVRVCVSVRVCYTPG